MPPKKITNDDEEVISWYDFPKERKTKKNITIETHLARFDGLLEYLNTEIEKRAKAKEKGVRVLISTKKILKELRKETPYIVRRRRSTSAKTIDSGFTREYPISAELAAFLQIKDEEPKLSRLDATRAICVYARLKEDETREEMLKWAYLNPGGKRNLQNNVDKKAIVPDKALSNLLGYEQYKKDVKSGKITKKVTVNKDTGAKDNVVVTSDALYYWTIQKLVNKHFTRSVKTI